MAGDIQDEEPLTATVTVLFCDLVSSTERSQLVGDDEADRFRRTFFYRLNEAVASTRGEVVKGTGDGLMVVFRDSAVSAVTCAATMHDKIEALDAEPPAFLRIGISAGEVSPEDGDYYGTPIVEAARLCAAAEPGQTLVTEIVRAIVGTRGGHQFRSVGALTLKGLTEPVATAALVRTPIVAPKPPPVPTKRTRSRWRYVAAGVAVVLIAAVVGVVVVAHKGNTKHAAVANAAGSGYTPRVESTSCEQQFRSLSSNVVCGVLVVPQDRAHPEGKWIRDEYRRYPATPGTTANKTVIDVGALSQPYPTGTVGGDIDISGAGPVMTSRAGADLVVLAPRGLYRSTPSLDCPEFDAVGPDIVSHAQGDLAVVARGQRALRACYTRLVREGFDPAHDRLADQAADVVDLMHALQLSSVDLAAANEGALVAFDVANLVPNSVRSIALLDPAVPGGSFRADPTASLAAVFDRYLSLCDADAVCKRAYPDLAAAYANVYREYSAHPKLVTTSSPLGLPGQLNNVTVRLDGGHIAQALAAVFEGNADGLPLLPQGVEHPNDTLDAALAAAEQYPLLLPHFPWAGFLSRICGDDSMSELVNSEASATARPEFAGYNDPAFTWMCDAWPVPRVTAFPNPTVAMPLFVSYEALYPRQFMSAVDELKNGNPAIKVFALHVPTNRGILGTYPACYSDLRVAFERNPTLPLDIASCEKREATITWAAPQG